ncbi:glycosyltransferase [Rudanella paleaurantiibacter]|uniref:Glycosyltransferase n=1 Tax=Rudanella paleaurantiibacter TaxID=2614655 RepID=A0A7J5U331_9BACT|nr:glycosyltransferase family 4 protein [Rudanella paleaurantiibacter]KAB7732214.1 glycosyltransferase [Rudanella paleaurantiibacter]
MKVTLLSTYHLNGGAGVAATRLHRALRKAGTPSTLLVEQESTPEPGVIGLANGTLGRQWATARFALDRLSFVPYEKDKSVRFHFSPAIVGVNLSGHPAVDQADVLHLHWTNFGFLSLSGLQKLVRSGKPIVWTLHDMWAFTGGCHYARGCMHFRHECGQCPYLRRPGPHDLSNRVFGQKLDILHRADRLHIVTPSRWLAQEALSSRLLGRFPVTTIPNTLDQGVFRPIGKAEAQRRLGLPDTGRPRLLFGSFNTTDPRKGFRYFADALHRLHTRQPTLQPEILVFGKGAAQDAAALPYPTRQLGVLTDDADIVAAYNAADALVVPSLEDNLPNTIVESLACGTPVVGFRTGGIPELIGHTQTGYLSAIGSADELADGLAFVLNHPTPSELRQQARQFAQHHLAEDVVAQAHLRLYQTLLHS